VRRIAEELGVSVSSVSVWTRDIELTPEQRAANLARAGSVRGTAWSERYRELRRVYQREGRIRARRSEPLHIAGCMLYWAEGAKDRNQAALANGDPAMVEAFMLFLRSCFGLTSDDVTFNLNVYTGNGLTIDEIEQLWMKRLGLPKSCARKHTVNHFPTSSSGRRPNKLRTVSARSRSRRAPGSSSTSTGRSRNTRGSTAPSGSMARRASRGGPKRARRAAPRAGPSERGGGSRPGRRRPSGSRRGRRR
jgi:hypothetical protein